MDDQTFLERARDENGACISVLSPHLEQQAIHARNSGLERITLRYAASIPIPMLSTLKHAVSMLRSHANASNGHSSQ
jgi:hypothetical protein